MSIRAAIFDVYGTLLEVGPAPPDADARWQHLCQGRLHVEPPLTRTDFVRLCNEGIARHHEAARARGIPWPEVQWASIVAEVVPEFSRLARNDQEDFLYRQMQTVRATRMVNGTGAALREFKEREGLLGLATNAQAYTQRELEEAMASHGLDWGLFERDLCFWSFEHGFSKPDPHVFRILTARLEARGIPPAQVLMVGDRPDRDLEPAAAFGWQTWRLTKTDDAGNRTGDWPALRQWLARRMAS